MQLGDLVRPLNIRVPPDLAATTITAITDDSRAVTPDALFIARKGEKTDGRAFARAALDSGAVAILTDQPIAGLPADRVLLAADLPRATALTAERFHADPSSHLIVIGVTGTNGKTTIAFLIQQALNTLGIRCGLMGTVVNDDGGGTGPIRASLTTPQAIDVSRTLAAMVRNGCRAAAIEVSSHALDQQRVGAVRFRAGIFTNLTHDHLDYHKTMDAYGAAKAMLFAALPLDGVAVVNIMDAAHSRMLRDCRARVVRCALAEPLATRAAGAGAAPDSLRAARVVGASTSHTDLELIGAWLPGGRAALRLPLIGEFNVMNALEALAVVHALYGPGTPDNLPLDRILDAFSRVKAPPGRLEPVAPGAEGPAVFVDYAHTDDALRTVLAVVRRALERAPSPGRLWCVFGCGGDRDKTKRPKMAAAVASLADRIVITSDNPRTEDPGAIIRDVLAGIPAEAADRTTVEPDREVAIRLAVSQAATGDAIVIAGKGHEDYQILRDPADPRATIRRHFDDREVAREALGARAAGGRVRPRHGAISTPA